MASRVKYIPSASKALEIALWFATERPGFDVYHVVKGSFFADKFHIARYGRPLAGDEYRAAWFGPLPQVVYGLLRNQPIEVLAVGGNGPLPLRVDEQHRVYAGRAPNLRRLSESDIEALRYGLREVDGKSFDELLASTHDDPAYIKAVSGMMDYRDFIPADAGSRDEKISFIEEVAPVAVF